MFVITEIKLEQRLGTKTAEQGQKCGLEDERQITDLRNHTPAGFTPAGDSICLRYSFLVLLLQYNV